MLSIVGEVSGAIFPIRHTHQIARRVVGVGNRIIVGIGDLRNESARIAGESHTQA